MLETLADRSDRLKERVLGIEIFGRPADYDTNEDAIVRVTANEVRKRLAQRYQELGENWSVRITLPSGSYVPVVEVREPESTVAPVEPVAAEPSAILPGPDLSAPPATGEPERRPQGRSRTRWILAFAPVLALAAAGFWLSSRVLPDSPFETFWKPFWQSGTNTLVCMANPIVYLPSRSFGERYRKTYKRPYRPETAAMDLSRETMTGSDWVVDTDQYVGIGDMFAASRVLVLLAAKGNNAQLRISKETSFTDLRLSASILIGAYSNHWSLNANQHQRFVFGDRKIYDRLNPTKEWVIKTAYPDIRPTEDYALVGRTVDSHTGMPVITAAGIGHFGTEAASEFLTRPDLLNKALQQVPADWKGKSLQFVLHTTVVGTTSGPVKVVASAVW